MNKDVEFIYVYKALAHPELNGYVQPFTLKERLLHVKEAKRTLGTQFKWVIDGMDNQIKEAWGNAPNSEWVIDPEGVVVRKRMWSNAATLRADLEALVGPVEKITTIKDLDMPTAEPPKVAPSGVVPRVERPSGARALRVEPQIEKGGEPFYVKLRAEGPSALTRGGAGPLYLGFHLDPIYHVHWNNLTEPLLVKITTPEGVTLSETELRGVKVEDHPSDIDPREFLVDVSGASSSDTLHISVHYFACNDEAGWCKPLTQEYIMHFEADKHGGRAMNGARGNRRGGQGQTGGRGRDNTERMRQMFERMDTNRDGKLTRDEVSERMRERFDQIDADDDGTVTLEEMSNSRSRGGAGGRGTGGAGGRGGQGGGGGGNN